MLTMSLPVSLIEQGRAAPEVALTMGAVGFVRSFIAAIGTGLLVAAVFLDRKAPVVYCCS
jgi:hypothetical protein